MKKKVSFDFDDTLSNEEVQTFAEELIRQGYEVHICTFRFSDKETTGDYTKSWWHVKKDGIWFGKRFKNTYHSDIWEVAERLGIKFEHIHFTNYKHKSIFFGDNQDFLFHLDDNVTQFSKIKSTDVKSVLYIPGGSWRKQILDILKTGQR